MRALFAGFTTRGKSFLAAGSPRASSGLASASAPCCSIGDRAGGAAAAGRAGHQPGPVPDPLHPPGEPAAGAGRAAAPSVALRLENVSRLPTGLLLAEDTLPYSLGITAPLRAGADRAGRLAGAELPDPVRDPGQVHHRPAAGPGGRRVRAGRAHPLVRRPRARWWSPRRSSRCRRPAGRELARRGRRRGPGPRTPPGEDDVIPRPYRDGDELRRVHWRSTARHGELMVRREEQRWRNRAVLLLDTRARAHSGPGAGSSFEFAVSAAASIGVHLARGGIDGAAASPTPGPVTAPGSFEDALLDSLAVIKQSRGIDLARGLDQVHRRDRRAVRGGGRAAVGRARPGGSPRPGGTPARPWPCCSPCPAGRPPAAGCRRPGRGGRGRRDAARGGLAGGHGHRGHPAGRPPGTSCGTRPDCPAATGRSSPGLSRAGGGSSR